MLQCFCRWCLNSLQMEAGMKVHINETNAGDFQTTFSHPGTTRPKTPKVGSTFTRFADIARVESNRNTITYLRSCQVGIKGQPVEPATKLLTIALFTKATITTQLKEINPTRDNQM